MSVQDQDAIGFINAISNTIDSAIHSGLPPAQCVNALMSTAITLVRLMSRGDQKLIEASAEILHEMIDTLLEQGPVVVVQSSSDALN